MREFHYVRTLGPEGGVDACEGPAVGVDLDTILAPGVPPWRVSLELIAALCEILDIADEDKEVHGDVDPRYIFLDETGALSLEGFGTLRDSPVPGADPKAPSTDLYGLGAVAIRILSAHRLPAQLPETQASHDDAVIDAVLEVDLEGLPEAMQGDVQWFLAKLLSHDAGERPSALDTWRTFIAFASAVEGPGLGDWAAEAVEGNGDRRSSDITPSDAEVLTGARRGAGPLSQRLPIPQGAGGTAFWTKDDMKKAVHGNEEVQAERPPMGVGGGTATNFWKPEQLAAMADGKADAPRPKRAVGEGQRRAQSEVFRKQQASREVKVAPAADATQATEAGPKRKPARPAQPARPERAPLTPRVEGPVAMRPEPVPVSSSVIVGPVTVADPGTRRNTLVLALVGMGGIGVLSLLLLVAVVAVVVAVIMWTEAQSDSPAAQAPVPPAVVAPAPVPSPVPPDPLQVGTVNAPPAPGPVPVPVPAPPTPKPAPAAPKPKVATPAAPKPAPTVAVPKPPATPAAAPVTQEAARVRINSSSRGTVSQCASRRVSFDGFRSFEVEGYRLPVACLVKIDEAMGTFMVQGSGEVTCDVKDGAVVCDKARIP
ncbi:MAG: hypothetical protein AAGA48_31170 [Myxococcota bacterium]